MKQIEFISLEIVKETVERFMFIKDISIKSRERPLPDARYVYYELCRVFYKELKKPSLRHIGEQVNRDHSSVLHGHKRFEDMYLQSSFLGNEAYVDAVDYLDELISGNVKQSDMGKLTSATDIRRAYSIKHERLSLKYRSTINKLYYKLSLYRKNDFIKKVLELPEKDLIELEEKFDVFFKVKAKLK